MAHAFRVPNPPPQGGRGRCRKLRRGHLKNEEVSGKPLFHFAVQHALSAQHNPFGCK